MLFPCLNGQLAGAVTIHSQSNLLACAQLHASMGMMECVRIPLCISTVVHGVEGYGYGLRSTLGSAWTCLRAVGVPMDATTHLNTSDDFMTMAKEARNTWTHYYT